MRIYIPVLSPYGSKLINEPDSTNVMNKDGAQSVEYYESILIFNQIPNLSWWKRFNGTVDTYKVLEHPLW